MPRTPKRNKKEGIATRVQNRVQEAADNAREHWEDTRDKAEDYVKHHPAQSVAIAAGVGAAVAIGVTALLMRPRRQSFFDRLFGLF